MMKSTAELGHEISLATLVTAKPEAVAGLPLAHKRTMPEGPENGSAAPELRLSRFQDRFASYWGVPHDHIRTVGALARDWNVDAVVVDGLNVLPYLAGVQNARRVWFAADEWIWHHLSQVQIGNLSTWSNIQAAAVKGLYERAYAPLLDRVWVVSTADRRAMRWVTGKHAIDVLPNGVDSDYYYPGDEPEDEKSCIFWGRLDFGPNIQALQWFCKEIWPILLRQEPDARFTIFGFTPSKEVHSLAGRNGITLIPDQLDIRSGIRRNQVVVLPFISGGGVKSKLLEAFSMGRAVVGTQRACNGLFGGPNPPLIRAKSAGEWAEAIFSLWRNKDRRKELGESARQWVLEHHSWRATAVQAMQGISCG
jgi:polysaccharide biosynthesis protein PslH